MSTAVGHYGFPVAEGGAVPQKGKPTGRRSDTTKAAILAAARQHFAASGYERATIRAIAADAGIDPAMVMRYFGNKEKLFAAAAEFDLRLPDLAAVPRGTLGSPPRCWEWRCAAMCCGCRRWWRSIAPR